MRSRCCMSETSGCAANMPCAGFIRPKVAAVTAIMMTVAISISMIENPASARLEHGRARRGRLWCVQCASSLDLPRFDCHETSFIRPASYAARITGTAVALARDEHLKNDHVVGIGRQRLDGPPPDERGTAGNDRSASERPAPAVEIVDVPVGVCLQGVVGAAGDSPLPPVASGGYTARSVSVSCTGRPARSNVYCSPRSCSIFCSASIIVSVELRAAAFVVVAIAKSWASATSADASSPVATITSTIEKPASDLREKLDFATAIHQN